MCEILLDIKAYRNIDIVCLTELWENSDSVTQLYLEGYVLASSYTRTASSRGGGVGIWVKNGIEFNSNTEISQFSVDKHSEFCYCSLKDKSNNIFVILNCYRSPSGNHSIFLENLDQVLNCIYKPNIYFFVCGDFNIDSYTINGDYNKLLDILSTYNLNNNLVKWPTRVTNTSITAIDHIFVNFTDNAGITGVFDNTVSDHRTVFVEFTFRADVSPIFCEKRQFTDNAVNNFIDVLILEDWNDVYGVLDVNLAFNVFIDIFVYYFNINFPLIKKQIRANNKKWINCDVKKSSSNLKGLHALSRLFPELRPVYKQQKKDHVNLVNATRKNYYQNIVRSSDNPSRSAWNLVSDFTNGNKPKKPISLLSDGENHLIEKQCEVASAFNVFFGNAPLRVLANVSHKSTSMDFRRSDGVNVPQTIFQLYPFTKTELFELLSSKLNNKRSCGFDDIPAFLIRKVLDYIISPLTYLVNLSFCNAIFPDYLKTGKVIPILKKGDPRKIDNYRPVTVPSIFSKIFEYSYLKRLNAYLESNNIIIANQHGFQSSRSTNTAVHDFYENLTNLMDAGECPVGIFCDLSRAFDCVDHSILTEKLSNIGIRDRALLWVKSYLYGRRQYVSVSSLSGGSLSSSSSDYLYMGVGVPQGSIMGPTLFLIYMNDIVTVSPGTQFTLYADDTSVLISDSSGVILKQKCKELLTRLHDWFCVNSLYLNTKKTQSVYFHNRQKQLNPIDININNERIEQVSSVKFLGLHIDECLDWKRHCEAVAAKVNSITYLIRNLRPVLTECQLIMLYHAQAGSRLQYGISFWGMSTCFSDVFVSQKRLIRCIAGVSRTESCRGLFRKFKILPLPCLYIYEVCVFVFCNKTKFMTNSQVHNFNTRRGNDLRIPYCRNNILFRSPIVNGQRLFNRLPSALKSSNSLAIFKKSVKNFLLEGMFYSVEEFLQ